MCCLSLCGTRETLDNSLNKYKQMNSGYAEKLLLSQNVCFKHRVTDLLKRPLPYKNNTAYCVTII